MQTSGVGRVRAETRTVPGGRGPGCSLCGSYCIVCVRGTAGVQGSRGSGRAIAAGLQVCLRQVLGE